MTYGEQKALLEAALLCVLVLIIMHTYILSITTWCRRSAPHMRGAWAESGENMKQS